MQKRGKRRVRMMIALLLAALQVAALPVFAGATTVDDVNVASAALVSNTAAMNGMVRVYLSSLGSPTALGLTVAGSYSINGDASQSLESGSTLTVGFNPSSGAITLTRNGATANMGQYFILRRHSTSGSNGIRISQAKVSANPYPGDLSFRAVRQNSGSYKLYTVAHIFIENYLYGVLPYEMGNSSNIEALKAQAVAARTYTVRMMQSRTSGYYDVVDTTSDQVYRGTPSGNANCVAAVDATKGIVLNNGSGYTMTYYSASNGGQMESTQNAFGKSGFDYLQVKDDPFDLANGSSTVKSKTIYASLGSASNPAGLISLLTQKAVAALQSAGYGATSVNTSLQTLKSVTPHTPMYAAPSRLYTKMDFVLTALTQSASGGTATATVTVTCDIFSELESLLGMSIQSGKNELWSVKKNASGFVLQARRYGHGVGMSQRGAMQMGKLGYTYDEILGFYYNNCKRVRQSFTNTILSAGSAMEETTVENAADLTQENASACKGTVKLVSSAASLAIRVSKSTSASLIGTLNNGAIVSVLANDGEWCYIQYGSLKGYVPLNALTLTGTPDGSEGEATSLLGFATVTANDYVNLRASGSLSASILSTAPSGAVLTVFSVADGWAHVQYCSTTAYVNTGFISQVTAEYPQSVVSTGSAAATVKTEDGTGSVNLRATASTAGAVLTQIPSGTTVSVSTDDGSWAMVAYNGTSGYLMSAFLTYSGETLENNKAESNDSTDHTTDSTAVYATVIADVAYLREQASEAAPSKLLLGRGDIVQVTEKNGDWCQVSHENVSGYLLTAALQFGGNEAEATAKAVVATESGSLNMRAEGRAGSPVIITIPRGAAVDVTSVGGEWCGVRYLSLNGYVMTRFLSFTQGGPGSAGTGTETQPVTGDVLAVVATQSGSLNLRAEARSGSQILAQIPQYATVTVHSKGAEWCSVTYLATSGYAMTAFLSFPAGGGTGSLTTSEDESVGSATPQPEATPTPSGQAGTNALLATVTTASGSLNLRESAMPGSPVLTRIPRGTTIVVSEKLSAWSRTTYAGMTGYVMNGYLTFQSQNPTLTPSPILSPSPTVSGIETTPSPSPEGTVDPSATPTPVSTPTPAPTSTAAPALPQTVTALVTTASGSLNLRYAPQAGARVLATIPRNATVTVVSQGTEWHQISYNGIDGYAMAKYLTVNQAGASLTGVNENGSGEALSSASVGNAWVMTASGGLNLRASPVSGAEVLLSIPRLSMVTVVSDLGQWCQVYYNGYTGYVLASYLTRQSPIASETSPTASALTTPTAAPTDALLLATQSPVSAATEAVPGTDTPAPTAIPTPEPTPTPAPAPQGASDGSLHPVGQPTFAFIEPRGDAVSQEIWPECKESGSSVIVLAKGAYVEVLAMNDTWCQIQYDAQDSGKTGYCLRNCLSFREGT